MKMKDRLKKARLNKGLSQTKLAELISVTPQSVQQWEDQNKKIFPRRDTIKKIAEELEVSELWLNGYSDCENETDLLNLEKFIQCFEIVMDKVRESKKNITPREIVNLTVAVYKLEHVVKERDIIKNIIKLMDN